MRYGLLGPLRVERDGVVIDVRGARQQALLVALVLARGRAVAPAGLVDALWEDPPRGAAASLQSYVSRLRAVLGPGAVLLTPGGYRLVAGPDDVDATRFERLAEAGAAALEQDEPPRAERLLREALALWRGAALEGFAELPFAAPEAVRLEEHRLVAEELLCAAILRSGTPPEVLDRLGRLVRAHPLREEARRLHALALYRTGRQSEALAALAELRRRLREEVGIDPGRPLRDLEQHLLRQDPSLEPVPVRSPPAGVRPPLATPPPVLCPVLVGRDREADLLRRARDSAAQGRGGTVVLLAPPGAGKSRLVREVFGDDADVLRGRAVSGSIPVPFRPIVEAVQGARRRQDRPADIGPYRAALGRLVPEWHDPGAPLPPLAHLAEGALRLLIGWAGDDGLTVVIEDVHWADDETLAVLEYWADNLRSEHLLLVLTARTEEGPAALRLVQQLEIRRSATVLRLSPLPARQIEAMATACLGAEPSAALVAGLVERSAGIPLFVEELLAAAEEPGRAVPASFAQAVQSRIHDLPAPFLDVLRAAAVLGGRIDWRLLAGTTGLPPDDVLTALRAGADVRLLATVDGELTFRHALHRDAVLADVLPPERAALAGAALRALRNAWPELPGTSCQQAADLAEQAGDREQAVALLAEAARRASADGALGTAEVLLDRARGLARPSMETDLQEALLDVLARAARWERARELGAQLLARLDRSGEHQRAAGVLVRLAEVATAAADHDRARDYLARARSHLADDVLRLRADLAAAECDVAQGLPSAEDRAAEVAARAEALGQPDPEERALLLVGRCQRSRDLDVAEQTFARVRARAQADGDRLRAALALAELGSVDVLRAAPADRLVQAATEAEGLGAVAVAGVAQLHAAITHFLRAERPAGLTRARRARGLAERYGLPVLVRGSWVVEASLHGMTGDLDRVEEALATVDRDEDSAWAARAWGNGRAVAHLSLERRDAALEALRRAWRAGDEDRSEQGPLYPLAALVEAVETGADLYAEAPGARWSAVVTEGLVLAGRAVLAGRRGAGATAEQCYARARRLLVPMPWYQHVTARLVAERAIADGWGRPDGWLTEAAEWLAGNGVPAVAAACTRLQPWAPGGTTTFLGAELTPRERDVLDLLATGLSNRQIADRLTVSVRTVEKHVERLLQKTATRSRTALAVLATTTYAGPRT